MNKNLKFFLNILIFFLSIFFVYSINFNNHWYVSPESFTQVYNSLILNSGFKAEFHDHPGHSLILFVSLWLNFLDLINLITTSNFQDISKSNNLLIDLNNIVAYAKMFNVIILLFFLTFFYKYLKLISKDKYLIYLFLLVILTSNSLLISITTLKAEFLSAVTIYISFYFLAALVNQNKFNRKYVFFSGFFFTLSMFAKYQSIFIFILLPLSLLIFKKKIIEINYKSYEKKIYFLISNLVFITGILLIYLKYAKGINYFFLPLGFVYFYILIWFINSNFFKNTNFISIFLNYFLMGASICFVLLFITKPFHTNNINAIVNGFGQASMFIQGSNPYSFELNSVFSMIVSASKGLFYILKLYFFNISTLSLSLILILLLVPINLIFKNYKNVFIATVSIFIVLAICFFFSVRPRGHYIIYISPIIFCCTFILILKFKKNILYSSIVFILLISSFQIPEKMRIYDNSINIQIVCEKELNNQGGPYMRWWHKKIDQAFINKACLAN